MMLSAKYANTSQTYATAIDQACAASYRQSGLEDGVNKLNSYATGRGKALIASTGVNPLYPGAVAYVYKVYKDKAVSVPLPKLPTGCKPSVKADTSGAQLQLTWQF